MREYLRKQMEITKGELSNHSEKLNDLSSQMDDKFSIGGYDESARVGFANNLIGVPYREENAEFFYRKTGGLAEVVDGSATIKSIKGSSVVWNQHHDAVNHKMLGSYGNAELINNEYVFNISQLNASASIRINDNSYFNIVGHRYLTIFEVNSPKNTRCQVYLGGWSPAIDIIADNYYTIYGFNTSTSNKELGLYFNRGNVLALGDSVKVRNIEVIDLTKMFGAGNEPTTYEEFLLRMPQVADEYAYNEGEIVSANIAKYKSAGRNLWDEIFEEGDISAAIGENVDSLTDTLRTRNFIEVNSNKEYFICFLGEGTTRNMRLRFYDRNKNYIGYVDVEGKQVFSNTTFIPPANSAFVRFALTKVAYGSDTYQNNICINISDPSFDGQYEPYKEFVRELPDDSAFFNDVLPSGDVVKGMKGAGTAFDERTEKQRIKRLGVVDLGSLSWNKVGTTHPGAFYVNRQSYWKFSQLVVCSKYTGISSNNIWNDLKDGNICLYTNGALYCMDISKDSLTAEQFKTAMQGVYLVYELADPIVEDVEAANLSVNVWHNGTEEAIAKDGTPSTPLKATIDYDLDYPAQVKSLMQLHTETAALLQQLQSQVSTQSNE